MAVDTQANLVRLLAEGKTYFWALRHAYRDDAASAEARSALPDAGIDLQTLLALKQLEPSIARFPYPAVKRADHRYLKVPIPPDMELYFAPLVTEHGVEMGTELFPMELRWSFAHREIQYCTGGETAIDAVLPHGAEESKVVRTGDVSAIPAGARLTFHSSEEGGRFGHAHIFLLNLGDGEPQTFYDVVPFIRLQQFGLIEAPDGAPELHEVNERIEAMDWSELVSPRPGRSEQLPTWLRNGWQNREATRALDYAEGTKSLVVNSPDREPEDYLEWGKGESRCFVNPIIAEHTTAVTDCRFPAGYFCVQPFKELWTVLRGKAKVRQTLPPLHAESAEAELESGTVMVAPAGARLFIDDASDDLVVRRMAESCAHNGHWAMMEAKLVADGVDKELS